MKLELGDTYKVNDRKCTIVNNDICFFIGTVHIGMEKPMYVDVYDGKMELKCRHIDCLGKTCPSEFFKTSSLPLSKIFQNFTLNVIS